VLAKDAKNNDLTVDVGDQPAEICIGDFDGAAFA
jgi:hypothetical protein